LEPQALKWKASVYLGIDFAKLGDHFAIKEYDGLCRIWIEWAAITGTTGLFVGHKPARILAWAREYVARYPKMRANGPN